MSAFDSIEEIISFFDSISSADDERQMQALDAAIQRLPEVNHPEHSIPALLRIFERFPEDDGLEVFAAILSALEWMPGYEEPLVSSVRRHPSLYGLLMISRLMNSGISEVKGINLEALLQEVAHDSTVSEMVREDALESWLYQRNKDV
jgi:hypothetical protein